jgi:hypothetical protein
MAGSVQKRTTGKPVTGTVAAAIKKKPEIWIGPNDPRNDPDYIRNYPGTIHQLTAAQFAVWLKTQYSEAGVAGVVSSADLYAGDIPDSSQVNGQLDNTLLPPSNIKWDGTFTTVNTDIGILQDIEITFDPAPEDPFDGSFVYHVYYEAEGSVATPPTAATAPAASASVIQTVANKAIVTSTTTPVNGVVTAATGNGTTITYTCANNFSAGQSVTVTGLGVKSGVSLNISGLTILTATSTYFTVSSNKVGVSSGKGSATSTVKKITTPVKTSSTLQFKFPAKTNASSYTITVTGSNLPNSSGQTQMTYTGIPATGGSKAYTSGTVHGSYALVKSGSNITFTLTQTNGRSYSGSYSAKIQVHYAKSSSVEVISESVTI